MLILVLSVNFDFDFEAVFSFEKGLNYQNLSSPDSLHAVKKLSYQKKLFCEIKSQKKNSLIKKYKQHQHFPNFEKNLLVNITKGVIFSSTRKC